MPNGTIKHMSPNGWGFIAPVDDSPDRFFHHSNVVGEYYFEELTSGQLVTYTDSSNPQDGRLTASCVAMWLPTPNQGWAKTTIKKEEN